MDINVPEKAKITRENGYHDVLLRALCSGTKCDTFNLIYINILNRDWVTREDYKI